MLIQTRTEPREHEITPERDYLNRRQLVLSALAAGIGAGMPLAEAAVARAPDATGAALKDVVESPLSTRDEELTRYEAVTSYNNFYEFGTDKSDPKENAQDFRTHPWSVTVDGHCEKPGEYALEDLLAPHALEERIYRLRCVEAWSMVVPWIGIPLAALLERFAPLSNAKYVAFQTLLDPEQMPYQSSRVLDWPYVEGLRMDEAMHPLTLMAVGLYGHVIPNQNGAPFRLVVPWKYGFKSIKSVVRISFVEDQPPTSWNKSAPHEYGFYSNVNPAVDHPRWSQARERRIGDWLKRPTLPFNGYGEQVARLYAGMDLEKHF